MVWPPPGLERVCGTLWHIAMQAATASATCLFVLVTLLVLGGDAMQTTDMPVQPVLWVALAIGLLLAARAVLAFWRVLGVGANAVLRGYSWLTVIEVAADRDGRTGELIAGMGAFTGLADQNRSERRVARIVAAALALAGGVVPIPTFLVTSRLNGAGFPQPALTLAITVVAPLVLLLVAGRLHRFASPASVAAPHESDLRRAGAVSRIVEPWYASFDAVRGTSSPGGGRRGGALRGLAIAGVCALLAGVSVLVIVPLVATVQLNTLMSRRLGAPYSTVAARASAMRNLVPFAAPKDSSITPYEAGEAFRALEGTFSKDTQPLLRQPVRVHPPFPAPDSTLFATARSRVGRGPSIRVLAAARAGFSEAELAYLETVAANPIWEDFRTVARAPSMYIIDAAFVTPFPDSLWVAAVPIVSRLAGMREIAYANTARAALSLARGRPREAEAVLRETVSFGLALIEQGIGSLDASLGVAIVGIGHQALAQLYAITDPDAAARLPSFDPPRAPRRPVLPPPFATVEASLLNETLPRSVRWDFVSMLSLLSCANAGNLLFGPSRGRTRVLDEARRSLARSPAESAYFDLLASSVDRIPLRVSAADSHLPGAARLVATLARPFSRLISPRLERCSMLLLLW